MFFPYINLWQTKQHSLDSFFPQKTTQLATATTGWLEVSPYPWYGALVTVDTFTLGGADGYIFAVQFFVATNFSIPGGGLWISLVWNRFHLCSLREHGGEKRAKSKRKKNGEDVLEDVGCKWLWADFLGITYWYSFACLQLFFSFMMCVLLFFSPSLLVERRPILKEKVKSHSMTSTLWALDSNSGNLPKLRGYDIYLYIYIYPRRERIVDLWKGNIIHW